MQGSRVAAPDSGENDIKGVGTMQRWMRGGLLALALAPAAAMADTTAQFTIVSEYMFRGIASSNGVAVQGSLEYSDDRGLAAGIWASNVNSPTASGSGTEIDLWAGWQTEFGPFTVDVGGIWYWYPEGRETTGSDPSYPEIYAGARIGPAMLRVYYTDDFAGTERDGVYVNAGVSGAIDADTAWSAHAGISGGNGVTATFGEEYVDYGLAVTRLLGEQLSLSVSLLGTDLEYAPGKTEDAKLVLGVTWAFTP